MEEAIMHSVEVIANAAVEVAKIQAHARFMDSCMIGGVILVAVIIGASLVAYSMKRGY